MWAAAASLRGQGWVCALPRWSWLRPSPVRPLSGSPPLAGSALGRSASGAPLPGRWGSPPLCFAPPSFSSFFCPSSGTTWGSEVLRQGLMWVPILAQGLVLLRTAKWFHRSGLPRGLQNLQKFRRTLPASTPPSLNNRRVVERK